MRNRSMKKETMKRFSIMAFVMVVLAAWVVPGYSLDTAWDAQYRVRAITLSNAQDFDDNKAADTDGWIDQRFRLGIRLTEAPVSGYVQLQLGDENGVNGSHTWGTGGVTNTSVIFRQAYLDFPVGPVGIRAGRTYASHQFLAGGMFENIADRYIISYKLRDFNLVFIHAKQAEGSLTGATADEDRNNYNFGFVWKPAGSKYDAAARVYYVRHGNQCYNPTGTTAGCVGTWDALWLTAQTNIRPGPVNVYASAALLTGNSEPVTPTTAQPELDLSGFAFHVDVNGNINRVKVGGTFGFGTGDDSTTDTDLETFFAPGGASYIQSHIFWQAGENTYSNDFLNRGNLNLQNGSSQTLSNTTWLGLYADVKVTDDLTLGAKIASFAKTEALPNTDDSIGSELDLTGKYQIYKNLSLLAFAAWFIPDDGITKGATTCVSGTSPNCKDDPVSEYYTRLQWEF